MENLVQLYQALGDANRLRIINLLLDTQELCVCDIERVLLLPQTRVSRHLLYLKHAGIVSARRNGQWMHYSLIRNSDILQNMFEQLMQAFAAVPDLRADRQKLHSTSDLVCCVTVAKPIDIALP